MKTLLSLIITASVCLGSENLMVNGGFEQDVSGTIGIPTGWSGHTNGGDPGFNYQVGSVVAGLTHTGEFGNYYRIDDFPALGLEQTISVKETGLYTARVWAQCSGEGNITVQMHAYGRVVPIRKTTILEWGLFEVKNIPIKAFTPVRFALMVASSPGSKIVVFDDAEFFKEGPETSSAPSPPENLHVVQ